MCASSSLRCSHNSPFIRYRVLGTIDLGLIFHFLFYYLIHNYGNFDSVAKELPVQ